jgi:hypothetical protein
LQIVLDLVSLAYDPLIEEAAENMANDENDDFIELTRVKNGEVVFKNSSPVLGQIGDVLAKRTYDESGDYTVAPFTAYADTHISGDPEKISLKI